MCLNFMMHLIIYAKYNWGYREVNLYVKCYIKDEGTFNLIGLHNKFIIYIKSILKSSNGVKYCKRFKVKNK